MPDDGHGDVADGASGAIDAFRLTRLTRLRRELKLVCKLAIVAAPCWGIYMYIAMQAIPRSSPDYWRMNDRIVPGFELLAVVMVVALAALIGSRWFGQAGPVAARLVPVVGRGVDPQPVRHAPVEMQPMLRRLRGAEVIRVSFVLLFIMFGVMALVTGSRTVPAWQANHGHGGRVVTIGEDASVSHSEVRVTGRSRHRDYFLATPDGRAISEDGRPESGQRWTVLTHESGNAEAYLVGGHAYVLVGVLFLFSLVVAVGFVLAQIGLVIDERKARGKLGDLSRSVAYLAEGRTIAVRFGEGAPVRLTLPPLGGRGAARWLAGRRLAEGGVVVVVLAVIVGVAALWRAGVIRPAPDHQYVTVGFLSGTHWSAGTYVEYGLADEVADLVGSDAQRAGITEPDVTAIGTVMVSSTDNAPHDEMPATARVTVADVGSASPATVATGVMRQQRAGAKLSHAKVTAVSGLPDGWHGLLIGRHDGLGPDIELAGGTGGTLVEISLDGDYPRGWLERRCAGLAHAIASEGTPTLAKLADWH